MSALSVLELRQHTLLPGRREELISLFERELLDPQAVILERSPEAARQLAGRARRRVRGATPPSDSDPAAERAVVEAFLTAARDGDFDALLTLLDPNVVLRAVTGPGQVIEAGGAESVPTSSPRASSPSATDASPQ